MTKPGHSEAEDEMENAFAAIVVFVMVVLGLLVWGISALVEHFHHG